MRLPTRLAAATLIAASALPAALAAPVTWSSNGHQYELVMNSGTVGISWTQAQNATAALGGGWHLATVTSAAEQSFIASTFLTPNPTGDGDAHFWLGATDVASNGNWLWVTGETWSYTNWNSGEPNGGTRESYLALDARGNWKWNDAPNDIEDVYGGTFAYGYVIERTVPEPGSLALAAAALLAGGLLRRRRA